MIAVFAPRQQVTGYFGLPYFDPTFYAQRGLQNLSFSHREKVPRSGG